MGLPNINRICVCTIAFLAGVPWEDAVKSGSVMATKLLSNEFVAMQSLGNLKDISEHAKGVTSVFLVSFANFSSIGIISGAIKSLNSEKGDVVARFGLKLLFGATLVSFISAAIAGFFYHLIRKSLETLKRPKAFLFNHMINKILRYSVVIC